MKVTVYIPTKNRKDVLARAVDSVLNQTYQDIEVIVVSDGSTDDTEAYLKAKSEADQRLKFFIKKTSEGAPAARNLAIKNATGDFVTGLDDDDIFLNTRIELYVKFWQILESCGIKTSFLYAQDLIYRNGEEYGRTKKVGQVTSADLFIQNNIGNQIFALKSTYINAGLFDEEMPAWQDLEFFYRILDTQGPAILLDIPTQIVDDTPKIDRISIKAESRIRLAFELFLKKHNPPSQRHSQQLFLQMFSKFYGVKPTSIDFAWLLKRGFWMSGFIVLIKARLRAFLK